MSAQDIFLEFKELRTLLSHASLPNDTRSLIFARIVAIESSYRTLEADRNEWRNACARLGAQMSLFDLEIKRDDKITYSGTVTMKLEE